MFCCLSRVNHCGNSVERSHRFLNEIYTITENDCYTNIAPIDSIEISRSVALIGR